MIDPRRGKTAPGTIRSLQEVSPDEGLGYSSISQWVREFQSGRNENGKKHLSEDRPLWLVGGNLKKIAGLLDSDRWQNSSGTRRYSCVWSYYSDGAFTYEEGCCSVDALYALRRSLYVSSMQNPMKLLQFIKIQFTKMLQRKVIWGTTIQRQSSECHPPNSPRTVRFGRSQICPKITMIFAYDFHGMVASHRVPRTILCPASARSYSLY